MKRSGYVDCDSLDNLDFGRWRGAVMSATRGKRGHQFFVDLLAALDAMPKKRLIADVLATADGEVCAIGALGVKRGIDMTNIDPEDPEQVGAAFGIATCLAQEVVYMNDEYYDARILIETPEKRWERMRAWTQKQIEKGRRKEATRA